MPVESFEPHPHTPSSAPMLDGRRRVVIEAVSPAIDGGRSAIKRVLGDRVIVEADLLVDGHDRLEGRLLYRKLGTSAWHEADLIPMHATGQAAGADDRWSGAFEPDALGLWEFTVCAWVDAWQTWLWGFNKKLAAGQDVALEMRAGASLVSAAAMRTDGKVRETLLSLADRLSRADADAIAAATANETAMHMRAQADRSHATVHEPVLRMVVDRPRARFGAWYEMFPRSRVLEPGAMSNSTEPTHGTFRDAESRLAYIADLGFDIVYLPPIHPIGRSHRKGRDNNLEAGPEDPGSPWAIGSPEGGHTAVHPQLGTLKDFRHFVGVARAQGLEVALDIALQASPDHPYVSEHPEWFVHRADGSIQYAENPPKKYEDIYPFDFTGPAWEKLWNELRDIFLFWIEQGITIFRVDNPHTKPLPFWRWCLASITAREPRAIFLSEAFTRPKIMRALAKAGFSQSYTYFTWRTTKAELTEYVSSLLTGDVPDYFRPNFWPTTPDILPEHLQHGTRATFITRAALAATLSPSWGIYGPAFELQEKLAPEGTEEYARSEKYELRSWALGQANSLAPVLRRLNHIRRDNPALQRLEGTVFHETDNEALIAYSRATKDRTNVLLIVVNLDDHHRHGGWLTLNLDALGLPMDARFQVHDLVGDARYSWSGGRAFVELDPGTMPIQVFQVHRHHRSERSFDYYQ